MLYPYQKDWWALPGSLSLLHPTFSSLLFLSLSVSKRQEDNVQESHRTQTKRDCAGHWIELNLFTFRKSSTGRHHRIWNKSSQAQQQQYITDPSSRQRGHHKISNPQLSKENFKEKEKLVSGPDGDLTPGWLANWPSVIR
jgi:hypothetical protein